MGESGKLALCVGGILAGWEIDPGWEPKPGDRITITFTPGGNGQVPETVSLELYPFAILLARGARAGGRSLSQTLQTAAAARLNPESR